MPDRCFHVPREGLEPVPSFDDNGESADGTLDG